MSFFCFSFFYKIRLCLFLCVLLLLPVFSWAEDAPQNLALGAKVKVSSVLSPFVGENLVDGKKNDGQKSRWVSANADATPSMELDLGSEKSFNHLAFSFYGKSWVHLDFDIYLKRGSQWEMFKKVRSNSRVFCDLTFPAVSSSGIRVVFLRGAADNLVRLYEVELFLESDLRFFVDSLKGMEAGVVSAIEKPWFEIENAAPTPLSISVLTEITSIEGEVAKQKFQGPLQKVDKMAKIELPLPTAYGHYQYRVTIKDASSSFQKILSNKVLHVPLADDSSRFSSSIGAHWKGVIAKAWRKLGVFWLRSHDTHLYYWDDIENKKGETNWCHLQEALFETQKAGLNPLLVLEGAPQHYSTAFEGEEKNWGYLGYYPPSDLNAWLDRYVNPFVALAQNNPGRVWEIWNETWSYYRWRGLYGTPAELFHFNKINYDFIKKVDPSAIVMATDSKLVREAEDWVSYKGGIDDLLQLGYLRFSEIANYHAYGMITPDAIEVIKKRLWNYGRDQLIWSTETGLVKGPQAVLFHLLRHKAYGVDKIFYYNEEAGGYSDFFDDLDAPTDELAAFSTLSRNLGDGKYLGQLEQDEVQWFFFANKKQLCAVVLSSDKSKVKIPTDPKRTTRVSDMFGNEVRLSESVLVLSNRPLFVLDPSPELLAQGIESELQWRASRMKDKVQELSDLPAYVPGKTKEYFEALGKFAETLTIRRTSLAADENELRLGGEFLEIFDNLAILQTRRGEMKVLPSDLSLVEKKILETEAEIFSRTKQNGALLNSERLLSRAKKNTLLARDLLLEKELCGAGVLLARAQADLSASSAWMKRETVADIYRPKIYFRSLKRLLRSDVYNFIPGKEQKAVVSVANPFSTPLAVQLELILPADWNSDRKSFVAAIPPFSRQNFDIKLSAPSAAKKGDIVEIQVREKNGVVETHKAQVVMVDQLPAIPILSEKKEDDLLPGN